MGNRPGKGGEAQQGSMPGPVVKQTVDVADMKEGEIKEVEIGEKKVKALLTKLDGKFFAVGGKCTHFGAPLIKGAFTPENCHVRCPWHGACFNVKSGDIEDFPGLDSLPKFDVTSEGDQVTILAREEQLASAKRVKPMCGRDAAITDHYVIIGGGAAGTTCAETLRQQGFKGRVTLVTQESLLPYDRTKLSKAPNSSPDSLRLRDQVFFDKNAIEFKFAAVVTKVEPEAHRITFQDGDTLEYSKLCIATGGTPRIIKGPGDDLKNICYLRTPEDGNYMAQEAKDKNVVCVGTSFIGMEVATFFQKKDCKSVTCVGRGAPLSRVFGPAIGQVLEKMFEDKGVKLIKPNGVKEFRGEGGKLTEVVLNDDTALPADICVIGAGVVPATAFLKDSGIDMDGRGFIKVNKKMETSAKDVYAAGDITMFPLFINDDKLSNVQHWQMAFKQGQEAGLNMADKESEIKSVPFFWTQMFGKSIRFTGYSSEGYDEIEMFGKPDELKFAAFYIKGPKVLAVATMGADPLAAKVAEYLYSGKEIDRAAIKDTFNIDL